MPKNDEKKAKDTSLLRKLNPWGDAQNAATERTLPNDGTAVEDDDAPYSPMVDMPILMPEDNSDSDREDLTEEELRDFFDNYLGDAEELESSAPYDEVRPEFLDTQATVAKNIDEAEQYIHSLTASGHLGEDLMLVPSDDTTGGFAVNVQDTRQLDTFAPQTGVAEDIAQVLKETRVIRTATEDIPVPELPSDTDMMKAFGLEPKKEITDETRLFEEVPADDFASFDPDEEEPADEEQKESEAEEPTPADRFEYTDPSQNKEIFATFKSKYTFAKVRVILSAALALLIGLLENVPAISDIFGNNINFIAIDWVLAFICAALVFDRITMAAKNLVRFELDSDTVTLIAFALSLITTGITLFSAPMHGRVYLYNFAFAIGVFLNTLMTFITLLRDVYSFKVSSCAYPKTMLARVQEDDAPEKEDFSEYIGEHEDVCTVKKADFITSYFAHRDEKPKSEILLKIILPECLLFSVLFFLVSLLVMDHSLTESLGAAYSSFLMSVPFASFMSYCYPFYRASRRAYTYHSAIIGDKTYENYDNTAVIAFRDDEAFPIGRAKVKGMKLYGDRKIENVMYYASSIYDKLGGPLAPVFRKATLDSKISENVELHEVSREGVSATVDGKSIVIGTPDYMVTQCFEIMPDKGDEEHSGQTNKRILYLACEQFVIAKFYLRYTTTADFLYMASRLANIGVGTTIRTADPCIDDGLLYSNNLSPETYPVKVVKGVLPEKQKATVSAKQGGIVSVGTTKELVKTFLLCDKVENVKKINFVLKAVASILGTAVMLLLLFTGNLTSMLSIFPALYQIFWLIPIYFVSKMYL